VTFTFCYEARIIPWYYSWLHVNYLGCWAYSRQIKARFLVLKLWTNDVYKVFKQVFIVCVLVWDRVSLCSSGWH
jgi:hypothetical protein